MKVISQLLDYFVERGALTSVQLEALAKQGLYERPEATPQNPISTVDPLEQLWQEPVAPKAKRRGGRPKKPTLEQTELVAWIKQSIPKWEPSLEALLPVARRISRVATIERAAIAIRSADPDKLRDALQQALKQRDPAFDTLWTAIGFDRYRETLDFPSPGAKGPVAAAYRAILQCDEAVKGSKYAWLLKDPAVRWVYHLALAQRRLLSAVGRLYADEPEFIGRVLARDPHPVAYAALVLLHKAHRFPEPSRILTKLRAHSAPVKTLLIDQDGDRLFSSAGDGIQSVWDAHTGALLRQDAEETIAPAGQIYPQLAKCAALAFHPDGSELIIAGVDGTVQVLNVATQSRTHVWSFAVSPPKLVLDGARMEAALIENAELKRYDLRKSSWKRSARNMPSVRYETIAYHPDTTWMGVVTSSMAALVDPVTGQLLNLGDGSAPRDPVRLCVTPDKRRLISAGAHGGIAVWDWDSQAIERQWTTNRMHILEIAVSPLAPLLAVSAGSGVTIWDYSTGRLIRELPPSKGDTLALCFHPRDGLLATGSSTGQMKLWDTASWKDRAFAIEALGGVTCLAFSPDGTGLASGGGSIVGGMLRYWDVATGREVWSCAGHAGVSQAAAVSADHRLFFSSSGSALVAWNLPRCDLAWKQYAWGGFTCLASRGEGLPLAAGHAKGRIDLFDSATGKAAGALEGHAAPPTMLMAGSRGALASADNSGEVRIWDAALFKCTAVIKTGCQVHSLAISGDGRTVAAGGEDGAIRLRPASFFSPGPGEAIPQRPLPEWDDWPRAWSQALLMDPPTVSRLLAYYTENMEACFSPSLYSQSTYADLALYCPDNWNFW